ncbi:MAG: rod shape-determining protein [Clostridiales bacterium]|nr:rod shape-determining protein [Clostridiales bacterium]
MSKQLGIDLGTANTLIYMKGKDIILREPSVVAIDRQRRRVLAVGEDAKRMLGKTPGGIEAQFPLKDGVIADFDITARMLNFFFSKIHASGIISRPVVVICIPYGVTEVERRAVEDATYEAGAKDVALVSEPIAAAIGSGLRINGPRGSMIVDIGGGTTEVAVLSLNGIVVSSSTRVAGNQLDDAIVQYMRDEHQVRRGRSTAEEHKKKIGSVHPSTDIGEIEIRGSNLRSGLAASISVSSAQIREALDLPVKQILEVIRRTLAGTPPELSADILSYGIMLSGGGALLGGLPRLISENTGVRVTVAKQPLESVVRGLGRIIEGSSDYPVEFRAR